MAAVPVIVVVVVATTIIMVVVALQVLDLLLLRGEGHPIKAEVSVQKGMAGLSRGEKGKKKRDQGGKNKSREILRVEIIDIACTEKERGKEKQRGGDLVMHERCPLY